MEQDKQTILAAVRKTYAEKALSKSAQDANSSCCNSKNSNIAELSKAMGYSSEEVNAIPEGANLGLGCGNPQAIAALKLGETVLDLGSGGGFDCFLASTAVGDKGQVIGVDMTPEMIAKARANANKFPQNNIEFRLGEIEHLPIADNSINVIISNCVINLSPDKRQVFKEAYRVLKSGGRLAISDVVTPTALPAKIQKDIQQHTACVAGASNIAELETMLNEVGFQAIRIQPKEESKEFIKNWTPEINITDFIISATIEAYKP